MNNSIQEKKGNPVVTLKAQAEKFDFSKLRADKKNKLANSGYQAYQDIYRMDFTINGQSVDKILIKALINKDKKEFDKVWAEHYKNEKTPDHKKNDQYKKKFEEFYNRGTKYTHLLPKEENGNYRPFAKEVFKEMFKYAEAQVPSDSTLEELVTNCNQAAYVGALYNKDNPLFHVAMAHELVFSSNHKTYINCSDPSHATIKIEEKIAVYTLAKPEEELCKLDSSLEFTLESQDGKDDVIYKDGKLSLTVPRELRDYKIDDRNLFDIIKEYFYRFCEKLGFKFEVEIEHNFEEEDSLYEDEEYNFEGACPMFQEQPQNYIEDPDVNPLNKKRETSP
ncbi:MAG: hypothetical protein AB3P11_05680 [Wolbachia pipientis]